MVALLATSSIALIAAVLTTALVRRVQIRRDVMDMPSPRSSHAAPTPRVGGITIVAELLAA